MLCLDIAKGILFYFSVLLIGYYLVLYTAIICMMAVMMAIFLYLVIDANYPERDGYDSLIKANPGKGPICLTTARILLLRMIVS